MTSTATILLSLSIALLAGLLLSRLVKIIKLPAVTAYLIAGILVGPFCLGALNINGIGITKEQLAGFGIIADVALGFIALSIGEEFRISKIRNYGFKIIIITFLNLWLWLRWSLWFWILRLRLWLWLRSRLWNYLYCCCST